MAYESPLAMADKEVHSILMDSKYVFHNLDPKTLTNLGRYFQSIFSEGDEYNHIRRNHFFESGLANLESKGALPHDQMMEVRIKVLRAREREE